MPTPAIIRGLWPRPSPSPAPMAAVSALTAPHGSVGAAAGTAAVFLLLVPLVAYNFKTSRFKTYILLLASVLFRGVGLACHAASIAEGNAGLEAAFAALRAAGFGMAIGVVALWLVSWFKNCAPWVAQPFGRRAMAAASSFSRVLIPIVIAGGPILGAAAAGVLFGGHSANTVRIGNDIRIAASWIMVGVLAVVTALSGLAVASVLLGSRPRGAKGAASGGVGGEGEAAPPENVWRDIHAGALAILAAALFLDVAAAQRIAALYHPQFSTSDGLYYGMGALFELLAAALAAAPPLFLARVAMCGNLGVHLERVFGGAARQGDGGAKAGDGSAKGAGGGDGDDTLVVAAGGGGGIDGTDESV